MVRARDEANYLIFSDVHLGADLVQHARPWTLSRLKRAAEIDRDLASMLEHYESQADPDRPWRLVIAGDLVDFIGMSIAPLPGTKLNAPLTLEERRHGLGSTDEHAAWKMEAVVERHALVFDKLARFVANGHSLVLVRGNHDIDFHWERARRAFVDALIARAKCADEVAAAAFESRIEFCPWFFYVEGLLYVEHGHQYDELCSYADLLAPISPGDPKRTSWSLSDVLLRFIVRPTPGMGSEGHEDLTVIDYLRLAFSMGIGGAATLGFRYAYAIAHAVRAWRFTLGARARSIREEHERRMEELAVHMRVGLDELKAIGALAATPVTRRLFGIFRSLFLDRVALAVVSVLTLCGLFAFGTRPAYLAIVFAVCALSYVAVHVWSSRLRVIDASEALRRGAERVAKLLPARYVVMGHTHQPRAERIGDGATYVNLGNWGVDDLDGAPKAAPRTHLVIRHVDGLPHVEFCSWDPERGLSRLPLPPTT